MTTIKDSGAVLEPGRSSRLDDSTVDTTLTTPDGQVFLAQRATIKNTHMGIEDHGAFSVNVNFEGPGWVQGTGHYLVVEDDALLLSFVQHVIRVVGVDTWEGLPRRSVLVLRENPYDQIVGLYNEMTGAGVLFVDLAKDGNGDS